MFQRLRTISYFSEIPHVTSERKHSTENILEKQRTRHKSCAYAEPTPIEILGERKELKGHYVYMKYTKIIR